MSVYKISSSDLTNSPFVKYQAAKGKPIILSVGAAELGEIRGAVETVRSVNSQPLVLLHCVLEYPTPYSHANLRRISSLSREFPDVIVGYSDHCKPDDCCDVIKTAYVLGARVIEKHFTLDKRLSGNDHYHAMDPEDAKRIVEGIEAVESLLGSPELCFSETEAIARLNARRSIVSSRAICAGEVITEDMLTSKRPGTGISPQQIDMVVGRMANENIPNDTTITWEMVG